MDDPRESTATSTAQWLGCLALGAIAAWVVYRVVSGRRRVIEAAPPEANPGGRELTALLVREPKAPATRPFLRYDSIDETIMASFPASDPPASNGACATPAACIE